MRILFGLVVCLAISIAGSGSTFAAWVYNANDKFVAYETIGSSSVAAFSKFKAGYSGVLGGPFIQFAEADHTDSWIGNSKMQGWGKDTPAVAVNTSSAVENVTGVGPVDAGRILLHPGSTFANAILRFTATHTGIYSIEGGWNSLGGGSTINYILKNGVSVPPLFESSLDHSTFSFSDIVLSTNDTIDFIVNSNGDHSFDSTGLRATITGVPEPSSLLLFGLGGLGLAGIAKRRRARIVA